MTWKKKLFSLILLPVLVSLACALPSAPATNTPIPLDSTATPSETEVAAGPSVTPAPTEPPAPPKTLSICLGQEPNTLYSYGEPNVAARAVLAALYDGPVDTFFNGYQPVIIEKIPSIENGNAQLTTVKVKRGSLVLDTTNQPVVLDAGVAVFPAGCTEESCAVKYTGEGEIEMSQLIVNFQFKPGLTWSDGAPLTADDSVFAFQVASDPGTPSSKYLIERTQSYEKVDDLSVQWWGLPGFIDPAYMDNVWSPLPKHAWGSISAAELAKSSVTTRPPLGWGAYVFSEWQVGQYIRLSRNDRYFRAAEKLPAFDTLIFRFVKDTETGISALAAGECDLLDSSVRLESQLNLLTEMEQKEQLKTVISTTTLMERLDFGIRPATYDDGVTSLDRINFFADVRMRQAVAYCLDRQKVVTDVLDGLTTVPLSFVPDVHPVYAKTVAKYDYNTSSGIDLLQQMGWLDEDQDINTPRLSKGNQSIPDGTPLVFNYITTEALQRRQTADILANSLKQCGIGLNITYLPAAELYAPGPNGPLFGRKFDLAVYAVGNSSTQPFCAAWTQKEIPDAKNNWIGINLTGYTNADFEASCGKAGRLLPDNPDYVPTYERPQSLFANDLPSIPLYWRIKVAASRVDLCNFNLDPVAPFDLWNIEDLEINSVCKAQ